MWQQVEFQLLAKRRGFHLISDEVLENIPPIGQPQTRYITFIH